MSGRGINYAGPFPPPNFKFTPGYIRLHPHPERPYGAIFNPKRAGYAASGEAIAAGKVIQVMWGGHLFRLTPRRANQLREELLREPQEGGVYLFDQEDRKSIRLRRKRRLTADDKRWLAADLGRAIRDAKKAV